MRATFIGLLAAGLISSMALAPQATASGIGGSVKSATVWVPDYFGQDVLIYAYKNPSTLKTTKLSVSAKSCSPNAVSVHAGQLYVVCNSGSGGADQILVYDAKTNAFKRKITGVDQNGTRYFTNSSLIGIVFDWEGNLWTTGYNTNTLLRIPAANLNTSNPAIDREVIDSPDSPVSLAMDTDHSMWIVGQYRGGIALNFSDAVLNQEGSFLQGNPLNLSPVEYCISNSAQGCQQKANLFNNPEGVAVFDGAVWVSNNGGNAPAATIVKLTKKKGKLSATIYGGTVNQPFACPGGMFSATGPTGTKTLWVNDEGRNVTNTDCGASSSDQSAKTGLVMEFIASALSSAHASAPAPDEFTNWAKFKTSSPGFGGIYVQLN
jgi:hypothetical protein